MVSNHKNVTWVQSMYQGPDNNREHNLEIQKKFHVEIKESFARLRKKFPERIPKDEEIEQFNLKSFDQKGFAVVWRLIADGVLKGLAVPGPFHFEYQMLLAVTKIFYDPLLKGIGLLLDVKMDWFDFAVEHVKDVRKIVHVAHYLGLYRLMKYFCSCSRQEKVLPKDMFLFYEKMIKQKNIQHVILEKDTTQNRLEKEKLENFLQRAKEILGNNKQTIVELCKGKGLAWTGTKPLLASRMMIAEDFQSFDPDKWCFVGFEKLINEQTTPVLQTLLHFSGFPICPKGDGEGLKNAILSLRVKDALPPGEKEILTWYIFFKVFSLPVVLVHRAVRTGDFDLWKICLKSSLKMWDVTGKTNYWYLTTRHLFDLEHRFSPFHLQVYKQCFVTKSQTTKTNVGLDEKNEFINKFLKTNLRSVSLSRLDFLARNYNFLEELSMVYDKLMKTRKNAEHRKSTDISFQNIQLVEEEVGFISIPLPLLKKYDNLLEVKKIEDEMEKILQDYKIEKEN